MAYQSFGTYGSFRQLMPFDNSRKIIEARQEQKSLEQEAQQLKAKQQQGYMEAMREKLRKEQANRDRNRQFESQMARGYNDAIQANYQTEINNIKQEAENSQRFYNSLTEFSTSLAKTVADVTAKRKKEREEEEYAQELLRIDGLTPQEQMEEMGFGFLKQQSLTAEDSALKGVANDQAPLVGNEQVEPLRQMAQGSATVNQLRARLSHAGNSMDMVAEHFNKENHKFNLIDPVTGQPLAPMTLKEAERRGGAIAVQAHKQLKNILQTKMGIEGKIKPSFVVQNFGIPFERWSKTRLTKISAEREEELGNIAAAAEERNIASQLFVAASQPGLPESRNVVSNLVAQTIAENPGKYADETGKIDRAYVRDSIVLDSFKNLVESGNFDSQLSTLIPFLDNQVIQLPNGNSAVLGNIKNSSAIAELRESITQRERRIELRSDQESLAEAEDNTNQLLTAAFEDGVFTPQEAVAIKRANLTAYRTNPKILQRVNNIVDEFGTDDASKLDKEQAYLDLKSAGNRGELTPLEIQQNLSWLSKEQQRELTGLVDSFNPQGPDREGYKRADIEKQVKLMFRQKLGEMDLTAGVDDSVNWAVTVAGDYYVEQFKLLQSDPKLTLDQIAIEARKNTIDYISNGMDDPNNPFYVVPADQSSSEKGYVKNFKTGNYTPEQSANTATQISNITSNPSLLSSKVYLSSGYLTDIEGDIKNGRMITYTPWVNQVASITNQKPYEVINKQLEAAGINQKIEPGSFDRLSEAVEVSPALKRLLSQPTANRVNTAIIGSGNAPAVVRKGIEGEQDVMALATISKFHAPPLAAAMWALETGRGQTVHGPNALFNIKSKDGTGTTTPTREFINGQWINTTAQWANYNSPLESMQAMTKWANNAPGFKEAKTYRQAIQAIYDAGFATDPQYVMKTLRVLRDMGYNSDDLIVNYTGPQATNPNSMSPTLRQIAFYKTGDVMAPGMAPSEHLDVKQVDNPNTGADETNAYFDPDALENYVTVKDPKFGEVGLEELTDKFYGKGKRPASMGFYAPREYRNGTHLGWDYPTANGSTLSLKNGARVVGGYPTSFGYKAIIEIPSGKRFSFLHGYKI